MKKFSKIITESKEALPWPNLIKRYPIIGEEDWNKIFYPLIQFITSNPGSFSNITNGILKSFMEQIEEDYRSNWNRKFGKDINEFLKVFNLDINYQDLIDCVQPLIDTSDYFNTDKLLKKGVLNLTFSNISYKKIEELLEDIEDIHGKLKYFENIGYLFNLTTNKFNTISFYKDNNNISEYILNDLRKNNHEDYRKITDITISIYNPVNLWLTNR